MAAHPGLKLCSLLAPWRALQASPGAPLAGHDLSELGFSVGDAHDHDYQLIVRVTCGVDAPVWLEHASKPVRYVETLSNDPNPAFAGHVIRWPVPWDPDLGYWHRDLLRRLAEWAAGPCPRDPSHTRAQHIHSWPLSRPTEDGTEMTLGYGQTDANRTRNKAVWDKLGSETLRQQWVEGAWESNIDDFCDTDDDWSYCLAGGSLYNDGLAAAERILDRHVNGRGIPMTTNLGANKWADSHIARWLDRAAGYGLDVGLQLGGVAVLPNTSSSVEGAVDYATTRYRGHVGFVEVQPQRFDVVAHDYLLAVQTRIQRPRFAAFNTGAGHWEVSDRDDIDHYADFHGDDDEQRATAYAALLNAETDQ